MPTHLVWQQHTSEFQKHEKKWFDLVDLCSKALSSLGYACAESGRIEEPPAISLDGKRSSHVKRTVWICCLAACVLVFGLIVVAQATQEKKATATQAGTQSQLAYQKMIQSQTLTQQMAQNRHSYQTKNRNRTASRKMAKSGNGNGNGASQGGQGSRNGNENGKGGNG